MTVASWLTTQLAATTRSRVLANSGHDSIHDFKQGMDKIELRGTAAHSFAELKIEKTFLDGKVASLVHLDANDTSNDITVVTSAKLKASDFLIFV